MNLNGMQVIVISQPGLQNEQLTSRGMKPRLAKQLIGLGVVHVLNGVFCIIFHSISLGLYGFWVGIPFLVTGIIGITAGIRKGNCQVVAFNILSIISAILTWFVIISAMIAANSLAKENMIVISSIILAALGILEGIIAIWSSIVCCLLGACNCCHTSPPQTQPLILSAEQQAALMSNPMFLPNQQQSTVGIYPQQQTAQYNKQQPNNSSYSHNNFMSVATVEGSYTGLNTGMRRSLPSPDMDASASITTSIYEEIHDYLEVE